MFWCGDRIIDKTAEDDAVLFDQPIMNKKEQQTYEVLEENWISICIFSDIQTQWRIDQGVIYGLDYNAIKWIFELKKEQIKKPLEILADLQVLEAKICQRKDGERCWPREVVEEEEGGEGGEVVLGGGRQRPEEQPGRLGGAK